jgi:hypothetical protein
MFIISTRDTGYRSTSSAVAELVDNAIQAGATRIRILLNQEGVGVERQIQVAVLDNGCGMDPKTLAVALRFGGTTHFDDRSGPGRFGMGLPNSSVSQAKRIEVYTWQKQGRVFYSYLDVEAIATGTLKGIPAPGLSPLPPWAVKYVRSHTGTLVLWDQCDRLDYRKVSTIAAKLHTSIGRRFRYYLRDGVNISVNGEQVNPIDPLCLEPHGDAQLALPFGETLEYEVRVPNDPSRTSLIQVRFAELQVAKLHNLSLEEKGRLGISKGAGVSIVRANREIDYGWFFMGNKRKENYDDWWRCEVRFDPALDEYFGVTNSKQQITPREELLAILTPDLETAAHTLNSRVRAAFTMVRSVSDPRSTPATKIASSNERYLQPILPNGQTERPSANDQQKPTSPKESKSKLRRSGDLRYRIDMAALRTPDFYTWEAKDDGTVWVTINTMHPFFEEVYQQLGSTEKVRFALECVILASVRGDMTAKTEVEIEWSKRRLVSWSNALAAYLGEKHVNR